MDKNVDSASFETRRPVWGEEFVDRAELVAQLSALVEAHDAGRPSWVALLGPRKIGKTSILRELQSRRRAGGAGDAAWVDLFRVDARVQDVFAAYVAAVLEASCMAVRREDLAARVRGSPRELGAELAHDLSRALPDAGARSALSVLERLRRPSVSSGDVEEALELPERLAADVGPLWVIIDEIQELAGLDRQRPFDKQHSVFRLMRSVWQTHERVSYWATGSNVSMLSSAFHSRQAPFHGHFRTVLVGPFEEHVAARLLLSRMPRDLLADDAEEAAGVAASTLGGHPFYVQVLGEELELRRTALSVRGVKAVLQEILLSPAGRLALHLQGIIEADAGSSQQVAVLRALSRRPSGLSELVTGNPSLPREATHAILRRLEKADLVSRDTATGVFRVSDPALASYLRIGGLLADAPPSVLGDEGERRAAKDLMSQGLRPVFQSYRSLGPADLVVLEPRRRLAIQVKRTPCPVYVTSAEHKRLERWADEGSLFPVMCQVEPDSPGTVRYWRWSDGARAGRRVRFDADVSSPTVLALLP